MRSLESRKKYLQEDITIYLVRLYWIEYSWHWCSLFKSCNSSSDILLNIFNHISFSSHLCSDLVVLDSWHWFTWWGGVDLKRNKQIFINLFYKYFSMVEIILRLSYFLHHMINVDHYMAFFTWRTDRLNGSYMNEGW
jgi:hypothetical protein